MNAAKAALTVRLSQKISSSDQKGMSTDCEINAAYASKQRCE